MPIKDRAKELYKHIAVDGYAEDEGDVVAVSGLAEDLRDVLLEYWVSTNLRRSQGHSVAETAVSARWCNNRKFTIRIVG